MNSQHTSNNQAYDLIGDIHGCYYTLISMLEELGYSKKNQIYQHASRKIIFLGDFIDRGAGQKAVIDIVRPMIESGAALSVMGNHEFNAIAYATKNPAGDYLRLHNDGNMKQHKAFLNDYVLGTAEYLDVIDWFKTLPLWLDLGSIRIVHACWDNASMARLEAEECINLEFPLLTDSLIQSSSQTGSWQYLAVEILLKGKEIKLPNGQSFKDKDGKPREHIRVKWWDKDASTYQEAFMGPKSAAKSIPNDPIHGEHLIEYSQHQAPVFLGHYWLEGAPKPLTDNIACLDYSVAKDGGSLVGYRWDGEQTLDENKFISIARDTRD